MNMGERSMWWSHRKVFQELLVDDALLACRVDELRRIIQNVSCKCPMETMRMAHILWLQGQ